MQERYQLVITTPVKTIKGFWMSEKDCGEMKEFCEKLHELSILNVIDENDVDIHFITKEMINRSVFSIQRVTVQ